MDYDDFAEAERAGWSGTGLARAYVDLFSPVSNQLIAPMLSAVDAGPQKDILDLCCGHGNGCAALAEAGANATGLDFSPAMLDLARAQVPTASFVHGDAAALPFDDASFDAVICNVGIVHLPDPAAGLAEIARVLRPGGVAAMTSWREPEASPTFRIVFGALRTHGDPARAPAAPDFHLFSRKDKIPGILAAAGLGSPDFRELPAEFVFTDPFGIVDVFETATVRAGMVLAAQDAVARRAIHAEMAERVREDFAQPDGTYRVPFPAMMVTARRA